MLPSDSRRAMLLIFLAGALGSTGIFAIITVAPLLAEHLVGTDALAGIPAAAGTAGTAAGAYALAAIMGRKGRTIGLRLGYLVGAVGAFGAILAVEAGSFGLTALAIGISGPGFAAYNLGRFAAAELVPPERRAQVVGWVVWGATLGALVGPSLPQHVESIAVSLGLDPINAGFLVGFVAMSLGVVVSLFMRVLPPVSDAADDLAGSAAARVRVSSLLRGRILGAVLAAIGAQTAMVMVMAVTPVHLRNAGHDLGAVGSVMSAHFVGMFALAPVAGRLVTRMGITRAIPTGLVILVAASGAAGATRGEHAAGIGIELFALGLGWSLTFVAASTALTEVAAGARVRLQGAVDAVVWTSSAIASILGGALLDRSGYPTLGMVAAVIAASALAASAVTLRGQLRHVPA